MKMSKDIFKGIIIGASATLLLSSGAAYAAKYPFSKNLKAVFNDIKIIVDGYQITPRNANGEVVEPFIVDGTTYLPVRAITTALGKEVRWDPKTYTVSLGKEIANGKVKGLNELTPWENADNGQWDEALNSFNVAQETIQPAFNSFDFNRENYKVNYLLKGNYKEMSGKFAVIDNFNPENSTYGSVLNIIGDGNVLYASAFAQKGTDPSKFNISLVGINELEIVIKSKYHYSASNYFNTGYNYDFPPTKLWDVVLTELD